MYDILIESNFSFSMAQIQRMYMAGRECVSRCMYVCDFKEIGGVLNGIKNIFTVEKNGGTRKTLTYSCTCTQLYRYLLSRLSRRVRPFFRPNTHKQDVLETQKMTGNVKMGDFSKSFNLIQQKAFLKFTLSIFCQSEELRVYLHFQTAIIHRIKRVRI